MEIITSDDDGPVSTEDTPIVPSGLRLSCRECGTEFEAGDGGKDIPGGHKKYNRFACPDCSTYVAKEYGSNRAIFEEYVDLESVDEAFRRRCEEDGDDPDDYELVAGAYVYPDEVGDTVVEAFEYYPGKGVTNRLSIEADDVHTDPDGPASMALRHDQIDAAVEWYPAHFKPIAFEDAFGDPQTVDDVRHGKSVLRFVRVVE